MSTVICCKCNEAIRPRAVCSLGKAYHPHHFICQYCEKVVEPSQFHAVKGEVVCTECYLGKHAARCFACSTPIVDRGIVALGRKWHEKCFRCISCSKPLLSATFFEINGYLFCKLHFRELFSSRCAGCAQPIGKRALVAFNTKWHAGCFKCHSCSQPISTGEFTIQDGRPICLACHSTIIPILAS